MWLKWNKVARQRGIYWPEKKTKKRIRVWDTKTHRQIIVWIKIFPWLRLVVRPYSFYMTAVIPKYVLHSTRAWYMALLTSAGHAHTYGWEGFSNVCATDVYSMAVHSSHTLLGRALAESDWCTINSILCHCNRFHFENLLKIKKRKSRKINEWREM